MIKVVAFFLGHPLYTLHNKSAANLFLNPCLLSSPKKSWRTDKQTHKATQMFLSHKYKMKLIILYAHNFLWIGGGQWMDWSNFAANSYDDFLLVNGIRIKGTSSQEWANRIRQQDKSIPDWQLNVEWLRWYWFAIPFHGMSLPTSLKWP